MLCCGIDLIEVRRVRGALEKHGDRFLHRVFTPAEIAYCRPLLLPWPHYAARFAAKEAVFKALPAGVMDALVWREIGVRSLDTGKPEIELFGKTKDRLSGWRFTLSMSHVRDLAIAQVLAQPPPGSD